jgi:hypothetical protein
MRNAYKYLAFAIPVFVVIQAMAIAFEVFGLGAYVDDHGLPKGAFSGDNSAPSFFGDAGGAIHAIDGTFIIPLIALALLVVSFFAKVPGGTKFALFIVLDVIVQIMLAFIAFGAVIVGPLHALNAFVLMGLGAVAGRKAMEPSTQAATV